ncbi:MAG TPA: hypothetical protein VMB34_14960 [Acetobacteraceae bacterium]|nr:hypothetical protein [Acetobacteraceae bacterium]
MDLTPQSGAVNRRRRLLREANEIAATASLACIVAGLLTGAVGAVSLLRSLQFGPPLGEILHFGPYNGWAPVWRIDAVRVADQQHCVLRPAIMAASRGSMVVEQRLGDGRTFVVHWAGGPTSDRPTNCGSAADLAVRLTAMQTLLNADAAGQHWHFVGP